LEVRKLLSIFYQCALLKFIENELKAHFEAFGEITSVEIKRFPETGKSKGWG